MQMPQNRFKRALATRSFQVGVFLGLIDSYSAEIMAGTGFDWLLIDGEHAANDPRSVLMQLQAIAPYPVDVVVRTVDHDAARIKQYLDVGVQSLLVPMVESAAQARELVRAMRYPPAGIRGIGTGLARAARWNGVDGYFANADAEMCLVVQIESRAGLDALDELLAVEGVDGVFVGPSDLAGSLGHLGNPGHPEVQAAVSDAIARIAASDKAAGVFSTDPATALAYRDQGACFVGAGVDTLLLRNAALQLAGRFKNVDAPRNTAAY